MTINSTDNAPKIGNTKSRPFLGVVSLVVALISILLTVYCKHHGLPVSAAFRNVIARREIVPRTFELKHLEKHFVQDTSILITAKDTCSQVSFYFGRWGGFMVL